MKWQWMILISAVLFLAGTGFGILLPFGPQTDTHPDHKNEAAGPQEYICPMHPQIRQAEPGICPLCEMDLVPVEEEAGESLNPRQVRLSGSARILAGIRTAPVKRELVPVEIRMTGKLTFDETRLAYITARMDGRIDRMYANYTGIPVRKGDHLVWFYSPALLTAQEELLQAARNPLGNTLDAARQKLSLWGITPAQIKAIEERGKPEDHLTIYAPVGGIVIAKHAEEGAYVKTGTRLYTIADLSRLWVYLDAYETDLAWLKYGQAVSFTTEAYPGNTFKGRISFIDPVLNPRTRTVRVRVTVANPEGRLKPNMFVHANVAATVTAEGAVVERELSGKWISPMHPEVIKDEPGDCDVCGMDLVTAESLGFAAQDTIATAPLVIPASAPLLTGKRAIVYIQVDNEMDLFEGRDIELGPRAGQWYIVKSGLREGERVVFEGNFKIDSALQLKAETSMMNPPADPPDPPDFTAQTLCPIMGGDIKKDVFTDYKGERIYFCCAGCPEMFLEDPEKHLAAMRAAGIMPEPAPDLKEEEQSHAH